MTTSITNIFHLAKIRYQFVTDVANPTLIDSLRDEILKNIDIHTNW